jgi:transcriptional regulator with XRE-family HTH domain
MSFCMRGNMPIGHMPVKHEYSCQSLETYTVTAHNVDMIRLRELRRQRKLTQVQLAEMAGIDQSTLSKAENGQMNITLQNILAIADALEVQPAELFELPELHRRALAAIDLLKGPSADAAILVLESMANGSSPAPQQATETR